jgi:SAM-dependent methyltransferase
LRVTTPTRTWSGPYDATLTRVEVSGSAVCLWQVRDLERHVDRTALLAAENPPAPPYWAHLWSGARVLAAAVPRAAGRVLEVGCGLGLPGLVAARRGAAVVFVDREPVALAFARASARAYALARVEMVVGDFTALPFRGVFDLVLAAEVLYDRAVFSLLARELAACVRPGGRLLLADGGRIDTQAFYPALEAQGFGWRARCERVLEEGFPLDVRLVEAWRA